MAQRQTNGIAERFHQAEIKLAELSTSVKLQLDAHEEAMKLARENITFRMESQDKEAERVRTELHDRMELARTELDRRLEAMNEFRAQLTVQAGTFITRERSTSNTSCLLTGWRTSPSGSLHSKAGRARPTQSAWRP